MTLLTLANGKNVEVSQEEVNEFITQVLIPNPYWRYSGLLTEGEVTHFFERKSAQDKLKKVARYILIFAENISFTAYLFDKSEGNPDQGKEFNMPAIKKLRDLYQKVSDNTHLPQVITRSVHRMENICLEIGADPL